jgi:hypothetical protein
MKKIFHPLTNMLWCYVPYAAMQCRKAFLSFHLELLATIPADKSTLSILLNKVQPLQQFLILKNTIYVLR